MPRRTIIMSSHSKDTRSHPIGAPLRGQGVIVEREHDPYRAKARLAEPTVCPRCGAVFHDGRWQWAERPATAQATLCPACQRLRDHYPAGYLTLEGDYFREHRDEVMQLVQHRAEHAQAEHPLQRVMAIDKRDDKTVITTTDPHLARNIGEAVQRAWRGELDFHYEEGQTLLRVHWRR
jgi:NMD protein affecting ribosome stability and mRNA decay